MAKLDITQDRLKELLDYDPDTGIFRWKVNRRRIRVGDVAAPKLNKVSFYREITVDGVMYKAHRLAWLYIHGHFPRYEIDHIDGIKDNNALHNLRSVTKTENMRNKKLYNRNTTGVTGVYWLERQQQWQSAITDKGEKIHIGTYNSIFEAVCARKAAEIQYGYHSNHGKRTVKCV